MKNKLFIIVLLSMIFTGCSSNKIEKASIESDLLKVDDVIIQCPITVGELLELTNGQLMDTVPEYEGAMDSGDKLLMTDEEKRVSDIDNYGRPSLLGYIDMGDSRYIEIAIDSDAEDTVANALCTEVVACCKNSSAPKGIGIGDTIEDLNEAYETDMEPTGAAGSRFKYLQYGNYFFQFDKEGKNIICVGWISD